MTQSPDPHSIPPVQPVAPAIAPAKWSFSDWPSWLFPRTTLAKLAFVACGIGFPIFCFLIAVNGVPDGPEWQSGNLSDFSAPLLDGRIHRVMYPFFLYAMISLWLTLYRPDSIRRGVVRLGLYLGVLTSAVYSWAIVLTLYDVNSMTDFASLSSAFVHACLATFSPWIGWMLLKLARWLWSISSLPIQLAVGILGVGLVGGAVIATEGMVLYMLMGLPMILPLVCSPFWCLLVYSSAAFHVMAENRHERSFSLMQLVLASTGLAAYLAAWRATINEALAYYSTLPTEPPGGCFVATAAAQGHTVLVGSRRIRLSDGTMLVNSQMAYLKSGELAIKATAPRAHRAMRAVYNWLGPRLAGVIRNPWMADLAYLGLKPFELVARAGLRSLKVKEDICLAVYDGYEHRQSPSVAKRDAPL